MNKPPLKLLHGFDDTGRLYSPSGQKRDWWPPETSDQFRERAKCFVRQYTQEIFVGGTVDGRMTLSENIADNGGLVAAYQVREEILRHTFLRFPNEVLIRAKCKPFQGYKSSTKKVPPATPNSPSLPDRLPGLSYELDQLFFIGFARSYCSTTR